MANPIVQPNDNGQFQFNQNGIVSMQKTSGYIGISERDWKRVEEAVNDCKAPDDIFANIAYTLFGISGSAIITCISMLSASSIDNWIKWMLFGIFIVTLVMGFICLGFHSKEKEHFIGDISAVKKEIKGINQTLIHNN